MRKLRAQMSIMSDLNVIHNKEINGKRKKRYITKHPSVQDFIYTVPVQGRVDCLTERNVCTNHIKTILTEKFIYRRGTESPEIRMGETIPSCCVAKT